MRPGSTTHRSFDEGRLILITGEPGSRTTRLVEEALRRVSDDAGAADVQVARNTW